MPDILGWLGGLLSGFFDGVASFVYGMLPDADSSVVAAINSMSYVFAPHDLSFNLYYFVDMGFVSVFMSVWLGVTVAGLVIMAVRFVLDVIHKVADSIPVIG